MATLLYLATHGPDDPTKACIPFHLAANGAAEAGIGCAINLVGDAVVLIQDAIVENLVPFGIAPLRELMTKLRQHEVPIYV